MDDGEAGSKVWMYHVVRDGTEQGNREGKGQQSRTVAKGEREEGEGIRGSQGQMGPSKTGGQGR